MKAISQSKYEHLIASLNELERLLETGHETLPDVEKKTRQLKELYSNYLHLLKQLEKVIGGYEVLATDVKLNLLGKQLRGMQKHMQPGHPAYEHWHKGVQLLYSA